jgi:mannose-6-phosphate isomerase-like protein (cupin superfamily)
MRVVNLREKLAHIREHWLPKTVATVNDYDVRLVKIEGEFVRHTHVESDEFFLVIDGEMTIRMDDGDVTLHTGECYVVPRGVAHQPCATRECSVMIFEPSEIVNTGDVGGERTAPRALF